MAVLEAKYGTCSHRLIADAGATKTEVVKLDLRSGNVLSRIDLPGVNPIAMSAQEVETIVKPLASMFDGETDVVWFGAGCLPGMPSESVAEALRKCGANCSIYVGSDMLGAALALLGDAEGIACILGTGSNSCYVKDGNIICSVPPLGYILGDEGSATALGKRVLREYARNMMPEEVAASFRDEALYGKPLDLSAVYSGDTRRYLASFAPFIGKHKDNPYLRQLIKDEFCAFVGGMLSRYERFGSVPVAVTGSVAHFFSDILYEVLTETANIDVKIVRRPMDGLIDYFRQAR